MSQFGPYDFYADAVTPSGAVLYDWAKDQRGVVFGFELAVLVCALILGSWLKGIGNAYAAGIGTLVMCMLFNMPVGDAPSGVVFTIVAVISAVSALQAAGSLDYVVYLTERLLRKFPSMITFLAAMMAFLTTFMTGTGHTAFALLPVIVTVSKDSGIRPSKPLSAAVIASQLTICASPVSSAMLWLTTQTEGSTTYVDYTMALAATIPGVLAGCLAAATVAYFHGPDLGKSKTFKTRLIRGQVAGIQHPEKYLNAEELAEMERNTAINAATDITSTVLSHRSAEAPQRNKLEKHFSMESVLTDGDYEFTVASDINRQATYVNINDRNIKSKDRPIESRPMVPPSTVQQKPVGHYPVGARRCLAAFLIAVLFATLMMILRSPSVNKMPSFMEPRSDIIIFTMFATGAVIMMLRRINPDKIVTTTVFKNGMGAVCCITGIAWMSGSFFKHWQQEIQEKVGSWTDDGRGWVLPFVCVVASVLLYSQAVAARTILPMAQKMSGAWIIAAFPACSGLFIIPTYPTVLAAAALDDTGTTKLGGYMFDHVFLLPGIVGIAVSCLVTYGVGAALSLPVWNQ